MSDRAIVYEDDDIKAEVTVSDGLAFFHVIVFNKLSKTILRKVREVFMETCAYLDAIGYDRIYASTPDVRFSKLVMGNCYTDLGLAAGLPLLVWEFEEILYGA